MNAPRRDVLHRSEQKFQRSGLFPLDEPEAALSPSASVRILSLAAREYFLQHLPSDPPRLFPNEEQKKCGVFWRQSVAWRQLHAHSSCCLSAVFFAGVFDE